ncbi:GAF domain-like protein [Paxillus ammoniavirescens]|nr:GAF domain-like protein [Paxillus ammoniavirescens]
MHHADASLVPPEIVNSKPEFWNHVRTQLEHLLAGQRNWVTNLANASSLIYNSLGAFPLRFAHGTSDLSPLSLETDTGTAIQTKYRALNADSRCLLFIGFYLVSSLFPTPRFTEGTSSDERTIPRDENKLLLGPFCGKPACQFINVAPERARGVCADAFVRRQTILVQNVHDYPGHIACDGGTKSEIVCPLILRVGSDQIVVGVLDLDCLALSGFDEEDKIGLESIADLIVKSCNW